MNYSTQPKAYYSNLAKELVRWAYEENNRIKASHILKAAESVEARWRKAHKDIVNDRYIRPTRNFMSPPSNGSSVAPPSSPPPRISGVFGF